MPLIMFVSSSFNTYVNLPKKKNNVRNGELQFNTKGIKKKEAAVVIIQKYTRKWMARRVYLKLLSTTIFIQCCYR
jgi:hypothetical protein